MPRISPYVDRMLGYDMPVIGRGLVAPAPAPAPAAPRHPSTIRTHKRQPHHAQTVARVRDLFESTRLTYKEIGRQTGVAPASVCRYAQAGGWTRPGDAPVATDCGRNEAPSPGLRGRALARRLQDRAERLLAIMEAEENIDLNLLVAVMELLKEAKVLARRKRPSERTGVYFPAGKAPEDLPEILARLRRGATLDEIAEGQGTPSTPFVESTKRRKG